MRADYSPFPVGLALRPSNIYAGAATSPYYTLPGNLSVTVGGPNRRTDSGFDGRPFYYQYTEAVDRDGNPLHNICGSESFRSASFKVYPDKDGEGGSSGSVAFDYAFETTPENRVIVRMESSGVIIIFRGVNATRGESWIKEDDNDYRLSGTTELSNSVTLGYLDGKLGEWMGKDYEFRSTASRSLYWGNDGAYRSESESGYYAGVSGMFIAEARTLTGNLVELEEITCYGYDPAFRASVALVRRKNAPVVYDLEDSYHPTVGRGIYRSGRSSVDLSEVIESRKWKDEHGTYDRSSVEAFDGIGWSRNVTLADIIPVDPQSGIDTTARATFISADGRNYRLTIKSGVIVWNEGNHFNVLETRTILVSLDSPGNLFYANDVTPEANTSPEVRISRVEVADDSGVYRIIVIPESSGENAWGTLVNNTPGLGVYVLAVIQSREGLRWGHRHFGAWVEGDADSTPYYLNKSSSVDLRAESATAAAPSPTAADPTPATAPTAPNVSPSRNQEVKPAGGTVSPALSLSEPAITPAPTPIKSAVKPLETTAATPAKATPISESKPSGAISKTNDGLRNSGAISKTNDGLRNSGAISKTNDGLRNSGAISKTNDGLRNSGAISKTNDGLRNSGAISKTNDGLRNSGAISKTNDGLRNSGAISKTNDGLRNSGAISKTNDGLRNSGAISKTNDGLRNAGAVSPTNGVLRNAWAVNQRGSGGGLRSGNLKSGGLRGGSIGGAAKKGGGRPSRAKPSRVPVYQKILCGTPVSGSINLDVSEDFDPETGLRLPDKMNVWKADINGTDWTPEDYRLFMPILLESESATRMVREVEGPAWSANCTVKFDSPYSTGKILDVKEATLNIPNARTTTGSGDAAVTEDTASDEYAVRNPNSGTTIYAERVIHLP